MDDVLGVWSITWDSGSKTEYSIREDGSLVRIHIGECSWGGGVEDAVVKPSDNVNYPSAEGWMKASPLHYSNVAVYLKKEGIELTLDYCNSATDTTYEGRSAVAVKMAGVAIHWFRKGLRLHDNEALLKAIESCSELIPLYILDTEHLDPKKVGGNRMGFLLDTLKCLDEDLKEKGSCLYVVKGKPADVMETFIKDFQVETLTFERDTEPYNKAIDEEMMKLVTIYDVKVESFWGHTLYEPAYLLSLNNENAPSTMEGFLKVLKTADSPPKPLNTPGSIPPPPSVCSSIVCSKIPTLSDLKEYGYKPEDKTTWFVAGEKEAIKRMDEFLAQKKRVANLDLTTTDPTSLVPETTALSPYFSIGSLSVRLFCRRLIESLQSTNKLTITNKYLASCICPCSTSKPSVSLDGQIYLREYAYLIGYSTPNFGQMVDDPNCVCMHIPWLVGEKAEKLRDKWEQGQTGYPAVDACMNQLRIDGWMHNLARHFVACFLTRGDLFLPWEMGKNIFEKYLIDADWSINSFQWHWLSCTAFFQQYFGCLDPASFFKKIDPNGIFVKKYVPILENYSDEYIYEPWLAPRSVQEAAKCIIGKDYPEPMVDHYIAYEENMKKIKKIALVMEWRTGVAMMEFLGEPK